jgi:hypothetical protein
MWIDRVLTQIPVPPLVASFLISAATYVVGLLIALPFGFAGTYITTLPVYLGVIGNTLVLERAHAASAQIHRSFELVRPILAVSDEDYRRLLKRWFSLLVDDRRAFRLAAALFVVFVGIIVAAYAVPVAAQHQAHISSLRPASFPHAWYDAKFRVVAILLFLFNAAVIALTLATAMRALAIFFPFVRRLGHLPVIPIPTLVRARLRPIANYYLSIALSWSYGVALFAVLYGGKYDYVAIAIMGTLLVFGVVSFALPQIAFRAHISRSYQELCALVLRDLYSRWSIDLVERDDPGWTGRIAIPDNLADVAQLTQRPSMWVYDTQDALVWLAAQVAAVGVVLVEHALFQVT